MSFFSKAAIVAKPGFSRWLVPPAALAVHLCIGQAYGYSVFNGPLAQYFNTDVLKLYIFATAIFFLGTSAAIGGSWLEKVGPRTTMFTAACCFGGGFFISTLGVYLHFMPLIYLGYGVIGGCGLGLGYVSPVSTLIKWFPDRRGMATGMAIMGFGGGAMIGSPLGETLMEYFKTHNVLPAALTDEHGLMGAFLTMGVIYFISMVLGSLAIRIPAADWKPEGWTPPIHDESKPKSARLKLVSSNHVHLKNAHKAPSFWFLWLVLYLNVSAGIGILSQASPMIQAIFGVGTAVAAGFTGLLSLFNMGGRFVWSSASDYLGRKNTYSIYFIVGTICYLLIPVSKSVSSMVFFIALMAVIFSFYGGGFATIPAYLADIFGTRFVGAIHGRLLTAWSMAGLTGSAIINMVTNWRIGQNARVAMDNDPSLTLEAARKLVEANSYDYTMYVLAALLILGAISNFLVRPVHERFHMTENELRESDTLAGAKK